MRKRTTKKTPVVPKKRTRVSTAQAPSPVPLPTPSTTPDAGALDLRLAKSLARFGGALPVLGVPEPEDAAFEKQKTKALQLVALKIQGVEVKEAAEALGITYGYARNLMSMAGKYGWFKPVDPQERLELELAHKIVRNTDQFLDHPHPMIRLEMTKEAARGIGLFKQHAVNKDEGKAGPMVLAIKIEMPKAEAGAVVPQMRDGAVGGKPLFIEGEVTNG